MLQRDASYALISFVNLIENQSVYNFCSHLLH